MGSREIVKILESNGWRLDRVKGSHHIFAHPVHGNSVTVPHPKKDLGIGLVRAILKQAHIKD